MSTLSQNCIDWNRDLLKRELGLEDEDIIDLPILFKLLKDEMAARAVAYYPDMVCSVILTVTVIHLQSVNLSSAGQTMSRRYYSLTFPLCVLRST